MYLVVGKYLGRYLSVARLWIEKLLHFDMGFSKGPTFSP